MAPRIPIDFTGQRKSKNFSISKTGLGHMMGKTRKVSKGYCTGFVPDYRHAVETVAESEGLGSSGRGVTDLTASVDSSTLKRKCINLNVNDYDIFNVPIRTFSLSRMSQLERRDLEMRLKNELEQVRMLQRKIAFSTLDGTAPSTTNETHSCQNGSKRPAMADSISMSTNNVAVVPGRKKFPHGKSGTRTKGRAVAARRTEAVKQGQLQSSDLVMLMKQCETLLVRLMSHQHGWIFNEPVDVVKHNIPDYFNVIKQPMDLGTVKNKLLLGQYPSPMEFAADVRLTFKNAMTYNPVGHDVHIMAGVMSKYFEVRWKPIEKKIPATVCESIAPKSSVIIEPENTYVPPTKKQKITSVENKVKKEMNKQGMSDSEKQRLSADLEDSMAELPDNIIDFLKESTLNGSQISEGEDEIEIDIDTLNDDTLYTLRKLMDDYLLGKQKDQVKLESLEMEIQNESRFNNLLVSHCKGHEPADEDVDIGGDDPPPVSSSIPEEIKKDAERRNSNCSSSSSSSSESGSSSSDSDSGRSADGLGIAKNSVPANTINETEGPTVEHKESDGCDPNGGDFVNGHAEENALSNSSVTEPSCHQEGENERTDRQVSPEKLYRAALLRSRFADIIIKAQENTTEKGERPDPEKLKFEKEELERRRREEKARLQAEAKAAEEARRKAEEEAAAEAKRKRELEREAARQALLKMEKTVDINENSQFMEDLEMLRAAPHEHLIEEGSPESSLHALNSFKFPASSNPLEQLGLYMKNEEEEEEEEELEPQIIPDTVNDLGDSD